MDFKKWEADPVRYPLEGLSTNYGKSPFPSLEAFIQTISCIGEVEGMFLYIATYFLERSYSNFQLLSVTHSGMTKPRNKWKPCMSAWVISNSTTCEKVHAHVPCGSV